MKSSIHPTAIIHKGAKIHENVTIEPYAIIHENVELHQGVTIKAHAYIDGFTTIGEGTIVYPFASIGTKTQDLKYRGEKTYVKIGKNCQIREYVTINSSCGENTAVLVGDGCLIMTYCHIAHNCEVGNQVIMSNNATLAGHVTVGDHVIIGGLTPIHQFSRIGAYSMVGGMSRITHDIPPYTIGGGIPYHFGGINLVGLKRHGFSLDLRLALSRAFKFLYRSNLRLDQALSAIDAEVEKFPEVLHFLDFCRTSKRGLLGFQGGQAEEDQLEKEEERASVCL